MHMRMAGVLTLLALPSARLADLLSTISLSGSYSSVIDHVALSVACNANGGSTASCSKTANVLGDRVSVSGSADASYGALFATVNALIFPFGFFNETATASFSDFLTVLGGSGPGYISYFFDGSATNITDRGGNLFQVRQGGQGGFGFSGFNNVPNTAFSYQTPFSPFIFDVPFDFSVYAQAQTYSGSGDGGGQGLIDVSLFDISVLNADHQPIPFTITSQSGTVYPGQTPVPEPSSLLLGATLVALTGAMVRRRLKYTGE